jgi:hypothetical protein
MAVFALKSLVGEAQPMKVKNKKFSGIVTLFYPRRPQYQGRGEKLGKEKG